MQQVDRVSRFARLHQHTPTTSSSYIRSRPIIRNGCVGFYCTNTRLPVCQQFHCASNAKIVVIRYWKTNCAGRFLLMRRTKSNFPLLRDRWRLRVIDLWSTADTRWAKWIFVDFLQFVVSGRVANNFTQCIEKNRMPTNNTLIIRYAYLNASLYII